VKLPLREPSIMPPGSCQIAKRQPATGSPTASGVRSPAVAQIRSMAYWTSGLNATEATGALPVLTAWPSGRGRAGSATLHNRISPSSLPLTSVSPFEPNDSDKHAHIEPHRDLAER
jgi:hypothetical protein